MRRRFKKSAAQSVSLPLETLERLDRVSHELRINKSAIVKEGLDRVLPHYEARLPKGDDGRPPVEETTSSETKLVGTRS